MREWWSKLRAALVRRIGLDDDLREEIESHLAMAMQENLARGVPSEIAVRILGRPHSHLAAPEIAPASL